MQKFSIKKTIPILNGICSTEIKFKLSEKSHSEIIDFYRLMFTRTIYSSVFSVSPLGFRSSVSNARKVNLFKHFHTFKASQLKRSASRYNISPEHAILIF